MSRTVTVETMQADHRQWREAHSRWRQDIERWRDEHEKAIARLSEMQRVVEQHGEALADHARTMQQSEEAVARHEREIADYLEGGQAPQDVIAGNHQEQEGSFAQQMSAHDRIGKHHQFVMAQLEALEKAASAAM